MTEKDVRMQIGFRYGQLAESGLCSMRAWGATQGEHCSNIFSSLLIVNWGGWYGDGLGRGGWSIGYFKRLVKRCLADH